MTISVLVPPALVAVTVYALGAEVAVAVPEIAPVTGSITRPTGNAGEIVTVTGPLVITGVNGVPAWLTAKVFVFGV